MDYKKVICIADIEHLYITKGKIYDVTSSELFKGGYHYFHPTGIDLTTDMEDAPHLEDVMDDFEIVGLLKNC